MVTENCPSGRPLPVHTATSFVWGGIIVLQYGTLASLATLPSKARSGAGTLSHAIKQCYSPRIPRAGKFAFGSYYVELLPAQLPCCPSRSETDIRHDPRQPALSLGLESELAGQRSYDLWGILCSARPHVFHLGAQEM